MVSRPTYVVCRYSYLYAALGLMIVDKPKKMQNITDV